VTKLEAARIQLAEAIRLHFGQREPIAIHTLAAAAGQVVHDLLAERGKESILRSGQFAKPEHKKFLIGVLKRPENFFKHADNDPADLLTYHPDLAVMMIFTASVDIGQLDEGWPHECRVFMNWFTASYPEMIRWDEIGIKPLQELAILRGASPSTWLAALDRK
jgi:hypothetical protein